MSVQRAVALFHHRYAVPIISALQVSGEVSVGELAMRVSGSRDAVTYALADLRKKGLIEPVEGSRPRMYRLTPFGELAGPAAMNLALKVRELEIYAVALRKWSMPVIFQVGRGYHRYHEIEASLPGVTPRALALALREVLSAGLAEHSAEPSYAGARVYTLTEKGHDLLPPLEAFVKAAGELPD